VLRCLDSSDGAIVGAQLLAQQVVLAERLFPGRRVHSAHTLFLRRGRNDRVLEVDVDRLLDVGECAALRLAFRQGGDLVAQAQVLLSAGEGGGHAGRRGNARPAPGGAPGGGLPAGVGPPEQARPVRPALIPWEARAVSGPSPEVSGPSPELAELSPEVSGLWLRVPSPPRPPSAGEAETLWRALLAHASEAPALAHAGPTAQAGPTAAGEGTITLRSHTLTFLDPIDVRDWHLMRIRVPSSGRGRTVCDGEFHGTDGRLAARFETVAAIPPAGETTG
jgi:acyl-CoA thioesterase